MLQTLNFQAGGRTINAQATFFRYESGSAGGGDEAIRVRADGQDLGLYYPGDSIELPTAAAYWEIVAVNAATAGMVRLGVGRVQSARLVGVVSVVDKSSASTMADSQFCASYTAGASAGQGSIVLLAASGGSAKRLAVRSLMVSSATAGRVFVYTGTGLGSLVPAGLLRSKYMQAASQSNSVQARASAFNTAAGLPSVGELLGAATWYGPYVPANTPVQLIVGAPIVIEPGRVLGISAETLNRDVSCWIEVEEY